MPLFTVTDLRIRPDRIAQFEELAGWLAEEAASDTRAVEWLIFEVRTGNFGSYRAVVRSESWAEQEQIQSLEVMVWSLLGEGRGARVTQQLRESIAAGRQLVLRDRPELSYPPLPEPPRQMLLLGILNVRPGAQEAVEEFLLKLAEAIPKLDHPRRFIALETLVGSLPQYATLTPIDHLGELDAMLPTDALLADAYGPEEARRMLWGSQAALTGTRREILQFRNELSNLRQAFP